MRAAAARLLFGGTLGLIFLVDRERDAPPTDPVRHRHDGVRRLGKKRMVIVAADRLRPGKIRHIDHPESRVPAARPHLVAEAQGMMQPVPAPRPGRCLARCDVLPRHPPA